MHFIMIEVKGNYRKLSADITGTCSTYFFKTMFNCTHMAKNQGRPHGIKRYSVKVLINLN